MGLDITAYKKLSKIEKPELDRDGYPVRWDTEVQLRTDYTEKDFPGRTEGLEHVAVYSYAEEHRFRAGSYSGYNSWRNELAKLAGYTSADDCWNNHTSGPFYELINFSDCEGVIGPVVSAKLAKDFADYREKAEIIGGWFFDAYQDWEKAFTMAADNGAVSFH